MIIEGIQTNVDYQYEILHHPDFVEGTIDIEFINQMESQLRGTRHEAAEYV